MDESWTQFKEKIESKINSTSYRTWFSSLELHEKTDDTLLIKIDQPLKRDYIVKNETYVDMIDEAIIETYGIPLNFEILTEDELKTRDKLKKETKIIKEEKNIEVDVNRVGTNLDPNLTFDNYVIGKTNEVAQMMALSVAEQPGILYNPLFIYGKSGIGKTHLMQAIGNFIIENSNKKVLYIKCEDFTKGYQQIFRNNQDDNSQVYQDFRDKYRNVDVLIIDDIQQLAKKVKTQEEFFNTFESLYSSKKQIIIASDTSPDDLQNFEDRLKTRFVWGLSVQIDPPDLELKKKILKNKISGHEVAKKIDENVLDYIANNCENDVRHLENVVNRLYFLMTMYNPEKVDLAFAQVNLKDCFGSAIYTINSIGKIQKAVADYYGITVEALKSKKRKAEINNPRQVAMYLCHMRTEETWDKIGLEFNKDHSTVMHGANKIADELKTNPQLAQDIKEISDKI